MALAGCFFINVNPIKEVPNFFSISNSFLVNRLSMGKNLPSESSEKPAENVKPEDEARNVNLFSTIVFRIDHGMIRMAMAMQKTIIFFTKYLSTLCCNARAINKNGMVGIKTGLTNIV